MHGSLRCPARSAIRRRPTARPPSGVITNTVKVTLLNEARRRGRPGRAVAVVTGDAWSVDYIFTENEPSGPFTLRVEAEDGIAALEQLDDGQRAAHRTTFESAVAIDATQPHTESGMSSYCPADM